MSLYEKVLTFAYLNCRCKVTVCRVVMQIIYTGSVDFIQLASVVFVLQRAPAPVITSSPSEDHTYSAGPSASSPDEAYEGSDTDDS